MEQQHPAGPALGLLRPADLFILHTTIQHGMQELYSARTDQVCRILKII